MRLCSHIARLDHFLLPAFLCAQIFIERETSGNEAEIGAVLLGELSLRVFLHYTGKPFVPTRKAISICDSSP